MGTATQTTSTGTVIILREQKWFIVSERRWLKRIHRAERHLVARLLGQARSDEGLQTTWVQLDRQPLANGAQTDQDMRAAP